MGGGGLKRRNFRYQWNWFAHFTQLLKQSFLRSFASMILIIYLWEKQDFFYLHGLKKFKYMYMNDEMLKCIIIVVFWKSEKVTDAMWSIFNELQANKFHCIYVIHKPWLIIIAVLLACIIGLR